MANTSRTYTDSTGRQIDSRTNLPVEKEVTDRNPDLITNAPGSHPVGTGVGAVAGGVAGTAAGAAAGAAMGSVVPGVGTIIGGAIGAIIGTIGGGYAGKVVAETIDPTVEDEYWRKELPNRPYYDRNYSFDEDYGPAYGLGYYHRTSNPSSRFEDHEDEMRGQWESVKQKSRLGWDRAREAARDAWDRV